MLFISFIAKIYLRNDNSKFQTNFFHPPSIFCLSRYSLRTCIMLLPAMFPPTNSPFSSSL